jgi:hypothetical protein
LILATKLSRALLDIQNGKLHSLSPFLSRDADFLLASPWGLLALSEISEQQ